MDPQGYGDLTGSDDNERKMVASLRSLVERQDPAAKEADNLMLRRFLRARDLDIEKASAMFLKYLKWRQGAVPNGFISEAEVQNELIQKKLFLQGFDKMGRPIVVGFAARHYYSKRDIDEFKRKLLSTDREKIMRGKNLTGLIVYLLDNICARIPSGQEKFIAIVDLQGWGYSNCDIRAYLAALDIMQNYYPERLGKAFLIHVPYMFMKAWKMLLPFIDKNTKKKFVFVDDKNLKATLLEDIDESQLPEIYGGKLRLVSIGDLED